jgi:hypothetical protein
MKSRWRSFIAGAAFLTTLSVSAFAAPPGDSPPVSPPDLPTGPPILLFANVKANPAALSPSPAVPGSGGYSVSVKTENTGNATAHDVKVRVELRTPDATLESSEVYLGDLAAGAAPVVAPPNAFHIPLGVSVTLVALVSASNDSNATDNQATATPSVLPLPAALEWAGFTVEVSSYDPSSTVALMKGQGRLVLPGTPALKIPISFANVQADATGRVSAGDPLAGSPSPAVALTGANGSVLRISDFSLPASGPLTVSGDLALPNGAGIELVNDAATVSVAHSVLQPDMKLKGIDVHSLVMRDLPLRLEIAEPEDADLNGDSLFPLKGIAKGRPSWNMAATGLDAFQNASNDGMFIGNGTTPPPEFALAGTLQASTGLKADLKLPDGKQVGYVSLFPRQALSFSALETAFAGGNVSALKGKAKFVLSAANALPLDPLLVPTAYQATAGELDVSGTDSAGGFAGSPTMTLPADGTYAWGGLAPPADLGKRVFFATDSHPIFFSLGGHTPTRPHSYFVSRLKHEADGSFKSYPRFVGSTAAPLDPGLNLVTDVTSPQAGEKVVMNLTGSSGPLDLPGPKLNIYLRQGGVSGVWGSSTDAASSAKTEMYGAVGPGEWGANRGFPTEFTNVSLGFLDSDVRASNLSGNIVLRAPMGTGVTGDNRFAFAGMTVKRDGQLGEANVPPSGATAQQLAFWRTYVQPKGVYFEQFNDYLGTTKTFLGLNAKLSFAGEGQPARYVRDALAVDGLLFGGPGHPHPTRYGDAHLAMNNRWMDFDFHPEGVRLSDPDDATDPADPSTPLPWPDDNAPAALATVANRPGTPGVPATPGQPGWTEIKGAAKLPFYGDRNLDTYIDARNGYVTLSQPLSLSRELFAGMNAGGSFIFHPAGTDKDGKPTPNSFVSGSNWSLPANLLSADASITLFDRNLGENRARFFLGSEANVALLDTTRDVLDKASSITNAADRSAYLDKIYKKAGIVGKDYDPTKAEALAKKYTDIGLLRGWATPIVSGGLDLAHGTMDTVYDAAKDVSSGILSDVTNPINPIVKQAADFSKAFNNAIPVKLRYLRGDVELKDDQWDSLEAEAGGRIERVLQDGKLKFTMNRHDEYRLDLNASEMTLPFTEIGHGSSNAINKSEDRKDGLSVKNPYLRLLLILPPNPEGPRLDGAFGTGAFNLLDAVTIAGAKVPPPSNEGLKVTHLDASFGVGPNIAYLGAGLGIKGALVKQMTYNVADTVSGAFLMGAGIDDKAIDITGVLNPDVKQALLEGLAASGAGARLNGVMIDAGISNTLVDFGCFFNASYNIDAAIWAFLVSTSSTPDAILGGRLYGSISGEAICVVDAKGEITLLAQYTSADNNLKVKGTGKAKGCVDLWIDEVCASATVNATAQTNPEDFDVDVDVD